MHVVPKGNHRVLVAVIITLLLVVPGVPAAAVSEAQEQPAVVIAQELDQPRWTAYRFVNHGAEAARDSEFCIDYQLQDFWDQPVQLGAYVYVADEADRFISGFVATFYTQQTSYHAHVDVLPGDPVLSVRERVDAHDGRPRGALVCFAPNAVAPPDSDVPPRPPGTAYGLLVWGINAGDATWSYQISAKPGNFIANPGLTTSGSGAYLYTSKDFAAPVNVGAQASVPAVEQFPNGFGPQAGVTVAGERVIDIEHTLISNYRAIDQVGASAYRIWVEDGADLNQDCPCSFNAFAPPANLGPGQYTFHVAGAGAGIGPYDVRVWALDAYLP